MRNGQVAPYVVVPTKHTPVFPFQPLARVRPATNRTRHQQLQFSVVWKKQLTRPPLALTERVRERVFGSGSVASRTPINPRFQLNSLRFNHARWRSPQPPTNLRRSTIGGRSQDFRASQPHRAHSQTHTVAPHALSVLCSYYLFGSFIRTHTHSSRVSLFSVLIKPTK